jgi:cobalt/nickel transport protein
MKIKWYHTGLFISLFLAGLLAPLASSMPDGLERVVEDLGFIDKGEILLSSPLADYLFPGIESGRLATSLAGVIGVLLVFALAWKLERLLSKGRRG